MNAIKVRPSHDTKIVSTETFPYENKNELNKDILGEEIFYL